jgi:CHAT domain-containing protein
VRSTAIGRTGGATDFASLDYLIKAHEVTYALSSDLFLDAQSRGRREGDSKWAFAGYAPVFPDSTPPPELAQGIRVDEGQRSVNLEGKTYAELKYSEDEVRAIAAAFHREGDRSEGFFQSGATKKRFLATAGNYSIVHIASHGVIDEDVPALSGILFSPAAGKESADVLYSGEISALHLNAELLVLGVCEGGLGRYVRGEGVMALTRSFASAGARNILYSLWKVYDRPTSDLMQKFYTHFLAGETFSSALRSAKLEMIASAPTAFPLAWAGFVLQGE